MARARKTQKTWRCLLRRSKMKENIQLAATSKSRIHNRWERAYNKLRFIIWWKAQDLINSRSQTLRFSTRRSAPTSIRRQVWRSPLSPLQSTSMTRTRIWICSSTLVYICSTIGSSRPVIVTILWLISIKWRLQKEKCSRLCKEIQLLSSSTKTSMTPHAMRSTTW